MSRIANVRNRRAALRASLPPAVATYLLRVELLAKLRGDTWGQDAAADADSLAALVRLSKGSQIIVEIGTALGWTAGALAIANPDAHVVTFDPIAHERSVYLGRLPRGVGQRVWPVPRRGDEGPVFPTLVDLLFIDGAHDREAVVGDFQAWAPSLRPGAIVAFHDYAPAWPGVGEAIHDDLGLQGEHVFDMFVWRAPG